MLDLESPQPLTSGLGPRLQGTRQLLVLLAVAHGAESVPGLGASLPDSHPSARVLQNSAASTLRMGAEAKAQALGVDVNHVLTFSDLQCRTIELRGEHAVMRRLDRIWAGATLTEIEASRPVRYVSPFYCLARWMLVRGAARVNGLKIAPYTSVQISRAQELTLDAGATVLVRRAPIPTLIETAQAAGIDPGALLAEAMGQGVRQFTTAIGSLRLDTSERTTSIGKRRVRLTSTETAALTRLGQVPGRVTTRQELAAAMGTSTGMVDRVILQLRNKLGDGLISTVYGAGYLLEAVPPSFGENAPPALRPNSKPS